MTLISQPFASSDLLTAERDILVRVAAGGNLADVLRDIILVIEKPSDGELMASILLMTEDGQNLVEGAAPSLPAEYNAIVDGIPVAIGVGSCGTAAFSGQPVIVTDIANDPFWANYRDIALKFDLRACWSMPIIAGDGRILGTFVNYYREPKEPTERDLEVISMVTRTTAIAIERYRNEQARERAEEQRQLLTRELNHRVKNIFALVDSLLFMSAETATDVKDYSEAVRGRLSALNRAHELVQPGSATTEPMSEQAVPLHQLLSDIVAPYLQAAGERVTLVGSMDVMISPQAVTGMALILHELATNAIKYGALSHPDGRLTVSWDKATRLKLIWSEEGGPPVSAPSHTGFGSKLTRRTVEGQFRGAIEYRWLPAGLNVLMDLPATSV